MSIAGDWVEGTAPAPATQTSGLLVDRPTLATDGSFYNAADQGAVYLRVAGAWVRITEAAGTIKATLGATADAGHILLLGQAWPSTTGIYADLFAKLGGANLPDFQGYTLAGKKSTGAFNVALGVAVGEETHVLLTAELPAHTHVLSGGGTGAINGAPQLSGSPSLAGTPAISGAPSLSGAPTISGTPGISGAPTLTGAPTLSGAPSLTGSPSASDPGHSHGTAANYAAGVFSSLPTSGSGQVVGSTTGTGTNSATTSISVGAGTLAVNAGSLAVSAGSLAVSAGSLAGTAGSLAVAIGSLAVSAGTLAVGLGTLSVGLGTLVAAKGTLSLDVTAITVANTGTGTAHNNVQPTRVVNWQAKL